MTYDKIKLWIDSAIVGEQLPTIANYLDEANTQINHNTGEVRTFGRLDGLKVSIFTGGLSIVGSLPKFLYKSNVYPLDLNSTREAIEKLCSALHCDVSGAIVTGVEFGTAFLMTHSVAEYLARLGNMQRLNRIQFNSQTLYYEGGGKNKPKVITFYDKIAEAASKGLEFPDEFKTANLLRYEIRYSGRLRQQLKWPAVMASTLYDRDFYRMMVKRYQDTYFSISKSNQIKTDVMSEIETPTDAFNVFVARLINQSDQSQIEGFIDELKRSKVFADAKNYSRLKKKIQSIATKANITVSDELIRELDNDVKNCSAYV